MSKFNLVLARAGDQIEVLNDEVLNDEVWTPVRFVGVLANGKIVSEEREGERHMLHVAVPEYMRMAPTKVKWYCLLIQDQNGSPMLLRHRNPPIWSTDAKWIGVPFTVEVGQE